MIDIIFAFAPLVAIIAIAVLFIVVGHRARPHKHLQNSNYGIAGVSTGGPKGDPLKEVQDAADKLGVTVPNQPR